MIFVPWDFFSVVRIKSTLPTGLPSSKGVVITLTTLFNQIRKHHLSFKKSISKKNIITTQETVNHNTEYRISFRAEFPNRFFHTGPSAQLKGSPIWTAGKSKLIFANANHWLLGHLFLRQVLICFIYVNLFDGWTLTRSPGMYMKCNQWDKVSISINWCRISAINRTWQKLFKLY